MTQNRLAILGGAPLVTKQFPPYNTIDDNEKRAVMAVLDSGVLSDFYASPGERFLGGPCVKALEKAWCDYFHVKYAVAMNSATSALIAAVTACDLGVGDEVIVSPLTMSATGTAILLNGATAVFADVDPRTMNIDPKSVEKKMTARTKAIFVVHLGGYPTDMDPILEIAKRHNVFVLGDNAQSPGALYKGRFAGCDEDIGVFSLNCHKTIQCGEGGVAVTNNPDLALKLQLLRNHGEKCTVGMGHPEWSILGQNYRMTEMEAAVAQEQLKKLKTLNTKRQDLAKYLTEKMAARFDFLTTPFVAPDSTHVYYIYLLKYNAEKAGIPLHLFSRALQAEGIPCVPNWAAPIYKLPIYKNKIVPCPEAETWEATSLCIDKIVRPPQTERDMDFIVQAIEKIMIQKSELLSHAKKI